MDTHPAGSPQLWAVSPSGYVPQDGSGDFITHCNSSDCVTESENGGDGYTLEPFFDDKSTPSPQASPLGSCL